MAHVRAFHEVEVPGVDGVKYLIRSLEDGTLEVHGRGTYPSLWIAPGSAANVVTIVPVEMFASRDRRPLVRDQRISSLMVKIRRALEEAGLILHRRGSTEDVADYVRDASASARELDDLVR